MGCEADEQRRPVEAQRDGLGELVGHSSTNTILIRPSFRALLRRRLLAQVDAPLQRGVQRDAVNGLHLRVRANDAQDAVRDAEVLRDRASVLVLPVPPAPPTNPG